MKFKKSKVREFKLIVGEASLDFANTVAARRGGPAVKGSRDC
jgi:hypothetical protein